MYRTITLTVLLLLLVGSTAWASEPGQPMDCADWVMVEPGLACEPVISYPCPNGHPAAFTADRHSRTGPHRHAYPLPTHRHACASGGL